MATLSCNFKAFHFSKESGFEQFYNNHPEIKQMRALILKSKEGDYFALSIDADFTNFIYEHKLQSEIKHIVLHYVWVDKVAFNPDPELAYHGVYFEYEDETEANYYIAGPRYQTEASRKDALSETLAENLQKVLDFTYRNNDLIIKETMSHFKGN